MPAAPMPRCAAGRRPFPGVSAPDDSTVVFTLEAPDVFFLRTMADAPERHHAGAHPQGPDARPDQQGRLQEQDAHRDRPFKLKEIAARPVHRRSTPTPTTTAASRSSTRSSTSDQDRHGAGPARERRARRRAQRRRHERRPALRRSTSSTSRSSTRPASSRSCRSSTRTQRDEWKSEFKLNLKPVSVDLSDKRVRQAMYYAIDRRDDQRPAVRRQEPDPLEPARVQGIRRLNKYEFDPQKAKDLLAAAAGRRQVRPQQARSASCTRPTSPMAARSPRSSSSSWRPSGFKVELNAVDIDTYNSLATHERDPRPVRHVVRRGRQRGPEPVPFVASTSTAANEDPARPVPGYYQLRPARSVQQGAHAGRPCRAGRDLPPGRARSSTRTCRSCTSGSWPACTRSTSASRVSRCPSFERYVTIDAIDWSVTG